MRLDTAIYLDPDFLPEVQDRCLGLKTDADLWDQHSTWIMERAYFL